MGKKILTYVLAILGGAAAGFSLTTLVQALLLGEGAGVVPLVGIVVGLLLVGAAHAVYRRWRKSVGLGLGAFGGTVFAVSTLLTLILMARGDVTSGAIGYVLLGGVGVLLGLWLVSLGVPGAGAPRKPLPLGIGAVLAIVGLAGITVGTARSTGAVLAAIGLVGVMIYLVGLFLSQLDDDMVLTEHAWANLAGSATAAEGVEKEKRAVNSRTFRQWFGELGIPHIAALIATVYAAFPIIYVISTSLNPGATLTGSNVLFRAVSAENYTSLGETKFWEWFGNSLFVGTVTAVATVLMGAAAAYAFSRYRFKGRRTGLLSLLIIQMFPQILAFVAIFLLLMTLGYVWTPIGLNSRIALIMVYLGGALGANTFLMYGFFNTIPKELDEAAKIDGASHTVIFWTIILRLVAPILAVVALLSFVGTFNEFIIAKLVLQSESNWTLAVGMYQWVSSLLNQNWGLFAAGAVIGAIPILLLFLFLQKYIVGGLTAGSVKG